MQQKISLENGNILNLMDQAENNELKQKREELTLVHGNIQHIDDVVQGALQWKNYEMRRYRMLISQLSPMQQGTNAQGHGLTNELESTGYGNQAMNMEGSQGAAEAENTNPTLTCSICCLRGACMLILPCQHLCACKSCEVNLTLCPVCGSAKTNVIEARFG
jgi:E3 ubiquitin-protein ligase BOI-like protein